MDNVYSKEEELPTDVKIIRIEPISDSDMNKIDKLVKKIESMSELPYPKNEEIHRLSEEIRLVRDRIGVQEELIVKLHQLTENITKLQSTFMDTMSADYVKNIDTIVDRFTKQMSQRSEMFSERLYSFLENLNVKIDATMENLNTKMGTSTEKLDQKGVLIDNMYRKYNNLEHNFVRSMERLNSSAEKNDKTADALTELLSDIKTAIQMLNAGTAENTDGMKTLTTKITEQIMNVESAYVNLDSLKNTIQEMLDENRNVHIKLNESAASLSEKLGEIIEMQPDLRTAIAALTESSQRIDDSSTHLMSVVQDIATSRLLIETATNDMKDKSRELNNASHGVENAVQNIDASMRMVIDQTKDAAERGNAVLSSTAGKIDDLVAVISAESDTIRGLLGNIEQVVKTYDERLQTVNIKIADQLEKNTDIVSMINVLKCDVSERLEIMTEIKESILRSEKLLLTNSSGLSTLLSDISNREAAMESFIQGLNMIKERTGKNITAMEEAQESLRSTIGNVDKKTDDILNIVYRKLEELASLKNTLENNMDVMRKESETAQRLNDRLVTLPEDLAKTNTTAKTTLKTLDRKHKTVSKDIAKLKRLLSEIAPRKSDARRNTAFQKKMIEEIKQIKKSVRQSKSKR